MKFDAGTWGDLPAPGELLRRGAGISGAPL